MAVNMYQTTTTSDVPFKPSMEEYNSQFQLLLDRIPIALENSKLIDNQGLTEAIKELAYTLNTYVMSSLATAEDERQHVRDRVISRHKVKKEG